MTVRCELSEVWEQRLLQTQPVQQQVDKLREHEAQHCASQLPPPGQQARLENGEDNRATAGGVAGNANGNDGGVEASDSRLSGRRPEPSRKRKSSGSAEGTRSSGGLEGASSASRAPLAPSDGIQGAEPLQRSGKLLIGKDLPGRMGKETTLPPSRRAHTASLFVHSLMEPESVEDEPEVKVTEGRRRPSKGIEDEAEVSRTAKSRKGKASQDLAGGTLMMGSSNGYDSTRLDSTRLDSRLDSTRLSLDLTLQVAR